MQMTPNERWWLESHFDRCWPMLERAVKKTREGYGRDYVWNKLVDGRSQLFPGWNSAVVTEIVTKDDGRKILHGWLAAGDRLEIEKITAIAEDWGRKQGCVAVTAIQRPGFLKKPLPGYRMQAVVMRKDL